jgi:cytochrome P450
MTSTIPAHIANTVVDPAAYAADTPINEAFTWLRANVPLGLVETEAYAPFWAVTKHADILEVSSKNDLFRNGELQLTLVSKADDARIRAANGGRPYAARAMIQMDAPDHGKYRALTATWFSPRNIRTLEDSTRQLARQTIASMLERDGRCDFASDVALEFPLRVIMTMLGVPPADEPRLLRLTQEIFSPQDPELFAANGETDDPAIVAARQQATYGEFFEYFTRMVADRRANPRDDLASVIANSEIDGKPIEVFEAISYYIIVATAGHDTTSSSIAGIVWALCEHPEVFERVRNDRSLIPQLIDEGIRWTTPVKHFMRSASADTKLRGQNIAAGDWLMLCYLSGNRDEEVFSDPFRFDIDRKPNKHLAFGYGGHFCLGQNLAKLEMRVLFEEFFSRLSRIEFDGQPTRSHATFVNGPRRLPVRYKTG